MLSRIRFTISRKIFSLIGLGFLGLIGIATLDATELAASLKRQKQLELEHLADLATSIIKEEHAAARNGSISAADAQARAKMRVGALRYAGSEYFFITDMQNRMIMHPVDEKIVGKDLSELKDPNGIRIVAQLTREVARDGSGFVAYSWPKPGSDKPQPKLSYAAGFAPWNWVVVTGVYIDDLDAQIWAATRQSLLAALLVLVLTLAASAFMARRITKPLHAMTAAMKTLASGKLDVEIPCTTCRDEIGEMAETVEVFKTNAIARQRLEAEQKEAELRAAVQRTADMNRLADQFEGAVGDIIKTVTSASTELEATATTLTRTADSTQQLATTVSAASEEASTNVQAVASATHEMTSSVHEISRQVQSSSQIAAEAVRQAERTDARVNELSQAANRIGDVLNLISAIAGQTNLLALNATIEAARAGEAGKGFAVVAQEVKALAAQTAKATEEIAGQITAMQSATQESVTAIKEIGGTIGQIAEIASAIAAAVEEQEAATAEISRNIQHASSGTTEVSANITAVSRGAEETGAASGEVLAAAGQLASESSRLKSEVDRFMATVRAA
ncbi:chemotaxis protein [Rhodoplanes elegans]|uniref:Chemotaxis protein n=1 Tax=Rhodoplanes elegans TaxID=29408 RepID=A0A327K0Y2_9BRAD|nr:cache domain-containing protein [Rhodoplanes elegans]MBK5958796.1 chemotaxis protein [Rhodoplanes elegans]RAI32390.1 chemotaxis protein [Rhodoplanes elegans]